MVITSAFGERLRLWRGRRGVSQLALASAASTTQRHISFLESGRSLPRAEVVHRLAGALALSARERNELLLAAGLAPAVPETPLSQLRDDAVTAALRELLDGFVPYPAVITVPPGEVMAANPAMDVFYDDVDEELLRAPLNLYRLALHPGGLPPRIENFPAWAPHVTAALRDRAVRHPDSRYAELAEELDGYLPRRHRAGELLDGAITPMRLRTRHGTVELVTGRMTLANAADVTLSELELEVFLPADAASRQMLAALL